MYTEMADLKRYIKKGEVISGGWAVVIGTLDAKVHSSWIQRSLQIWI